MPAVVARHQIGWMSRKRLVGAGLGGVGEADLVLRCHVNVTPLVSTIPVTPVGAPKDSSKFSQFEPSQALM